MMTVYTAPACQPCNATKRKLAQLGIEFTEHPLSEVDPAQIEAWKSAGYSSAPIVVAGSQVWSGYRPDLIAMIKEGV